LAAERIGRKYNYVRSNGCCRTADGRSTDRWSCSCLPASARTTNAIERLHEEFKRRIKTQTVLPSAETAAMLFWALMASGQISMRKVDGWKTLSEKSSASSAQPVDLAA
jgi:transposase-like protein